MKYLVEHGTNMHNEGQTPLNFICLKETDKGNDIIIIKYLIDLGADINSKDNYCRTPMLNACSKGNESVVKYLVKLGVDINKKDIYDKKTPYLMHV